VLNTTVGQMYERPKSAADQGVRRRAKVSAGFEFMKSDYCSDRSVGEADLRGALKSLAGAARLVGRDEFYRALLAALRAVLSADLSMLMRYSRRASPEYLIHEGLQAEHMAMYLRGLYRVDPIYRFCRRAKARGVKALAAMCAPAERSSEYFNVFLRLTGMADDLAILLPAGAGRSIGLVYERRFAFRPREIAAIGALFPVIESLHALHLRFDPARPRRRPHAEPQALGGAPGLMPLGFKAALSAFLRDQLTPRERDIVHLILAGYPNSKIAERLNLSLNTIKNHRKRMYVKLDITTERELFRNFVNFIIAEPRTAMDPKGSLASAGAMNDAAAR
jgi:DNA-binding CsgD family transcriptional regulator